MANIYDWNLNQSTNTMTDLGNAFALDKQRKAAENTLNILNQANLFKLNKEVEQEQRLDKDVNASGWLTSQGVHPEDIKMIEGMWESAGLGQRGALGGLSIKMRNMPDAVKFIQENPKNKLAIAQASFDRIKNEYGALIEEEQNILAKGSDQLQGNKKYQEILQKKSYLERQANNRAEQIEQTQMMLDPKLRETMEEKALARQDRRDLQAERLQAQAEQGQANRDLRKDLADQSNSLRRDLKSMGGNRGPTEYQLMQVTTGLRKEFNNRPEVKEYNQIMPKIASIDKALMESQKSGNKVAVDQALITLFNKMTDPNSVVRESEYARTPENLSMINRIKGKVAKIGEGGAGLTGADRQAIVNMAKQMQTAYQDVFNTVANEYSDYARGNGIQPNMVIGERRKTDTNTIKYDATGKRIQ